MPLDQADIDKIIEALKPAGPVVTIPHLPANFQSPKGPSDWVNLAASMAAAILGVLAVYHQQTVDTPKPPAPPVVVTPVTPTPVDPVQTELREAIAKINARIDALTKSQK